MKPYLCLLVFTLSLSAQITVEGEIVDSTTGAPIAGAQVVLNNADAAKPTATTDSAGHFRLTGSLPPGAPLLVSHAGYIMSGPQVHYEPGANSVNVRLELVPEAVISGELEDADGFSVAGAAVCAVQYGLVKGQRIPQREQIGISGSLGEYRIANLPPGRYYVRAAARNSNWDARYSLTYYPGTPDPRESDLVVVHTGQQRGDVNIRLAKSEGVSLTGRVLTPAGARAPRQVSLQTQDFVDLTTFTYAAAEPDGSFLFRHVHPGDYTIRYLAGSNPPKAGELWAEQAIQVGSGDVSRVTLALQPATLQDVSGSLVFQDSSRPAPLSILLIGTYPGTHVTALYRTASTMSSVDGSFVVRGLLPGHYDIAVRPFILNVGTPYLPLLSAQLGSQEVAESGFDIGDTPPATLRIMLSTNAVPVSGRIVDAAGRPAARAALLFVATPGDKSTYTSTGLLGNFNLFLLAGDYRVYALPDLNLPGTFDNPAYLAAHANDFPPVHVAAGVNPPINLKLR